MPQPLHKAVITRLTHLTSSNSMALYGHMLLHIRQPEQSSSLIEATMGSIITVPLVIMPEIRAAAAAPWATEAGISLGPWHAPAMNMPSVMVATGSSFGCRSVNQPRMLQEMPHLRPSSLASAWGSKAPMRITMSKGRRRCLPISVSSNCTISLPPSDGDLAASVTSATLPRTKCMPSVNSR